MRNHDFVSDGFLAVIAASLVLLCSSLLAFAFLSRRALTSHRPVIGTGRIRPLAISKQATLGL
jgi:hypothetical protein